MIRKILLGLAFGLAASCALAQTAPSPADVGISKGTPDVFKLKGHDNAWTPFGLVDPSTHIFAPATNGNIAPNDCIKWGPGLTSAGAACNSVTGGATPANQLTIYTNHAGLLANVTTPTEAWTIYQQGFYAPGDGGEAVYNWNATSLCPSGVNGTPTAIPANGLSCILPNGQSDATPGRYILSFPNGSLNARQFGLRPGIGAEFDNSPLLPALFEAIGQVDFGPNGLDIIFPPDLSPVYTTYYFSQPFEITKGSSIRCSNSSSVASKPPKVGFIFPAGIAGVIQETTTMSTTGAHDSGSTVIGCAISSLGRFGTNTGGPTGATVLTDVSADSPQNWTGPTQTLAAGDGLVAMGANAINGAPLLQPGAYIQSVATTGATQSVTLAPPYAIGKQATYPATVIWRLPASEMRQVTTTAGSNNAVITGGNRPIKVGEWIWSEAFVFGTLVMGESNQVASATVNSGGSGYVGTSGTMTWGGDGCWTATNPVLNVTASGGVITAVTGIADPGNCNGAWPPNTSVTPPPGAWPPHIQPHWVPGGGLSGGSGASFNLSFANHVRMSTMASSGYSSPALPGKTGTYNLWTIPAGLTRRVGASTHGTAIMRFPIGLEMYCDQGGGYGTGCSNSRDEGDVIFDGMIGRYVTGSDCAPSLSLHNVYGGNILSDIVESCTLSSVYINENTNSPENDVGKYSVLGLCGFNTTVFIGGYISENEFSDGLCMGNDVNGNPNVGVPVAGPEYQGTFMAVGVGLYSTAAMVGGGSNVGLFRWDGLNFHDELTSAPTAVGGTALTVGVFDMLVNGYGVADLTNPTAIPSGTTVTAFSGSTVTISNPVAAPGVATSDNIRLTAPWQPCITMAGGLRLNFTMSYGCSSYSPENFTLKYDPSTGSYRVSGAGNVYFPTSTYKGYQGNESLVAPSGIALGSVFGSERVLRMEPQVGGADWQLQGDTTLNTMNVPGGFLATTNTTSFGTTLSAAVTGGTTTSVAVAACPNPALPVGTPIISHSVSYDNNEKRLGDLASCTGTTLTLQAAALNSAPSGYAIDFLQWYPAALVAHDVNGISFPVSKLSTDVVSLMTTVPCAGDATLGISVVWNGPSVATAGYNAPLTAGVTGATRRLVFCDGTSWTYH